MISVELCAIPSGLVKKPIINRSRSAVITLVVSGGIRTLFLWEPRDRPEEYNCMASLFRKCRNGTAHRYIDGRHMQTSIMILGLVRMKQLDAYLHEMDPTDGS
jgi:hypothetical protein